jgi:hypothetical protein
VAKKAPTVVVTKMSYSHANLLEDLRVAGHRINFMPGEAAIFAAYKMARQRITTIWSSGMACMGPEPVVALADAILNDDEKRVEQMDGSSERAAGRAGGRVSRGLSLLQRADQ